ncbi:MAG: hypothetical protein FWH21_00675 [Kiritimatiellaeota bacterium]|nr:hypothetical protein [Kiritimatiellota bacterium]
MRTKREASRRHLFIIRLKLNADALLQDEFRAHPADAVEEVHQLVRLARRAAGLKNGEKPRKPVAKRGTDVVSYLTSMSVFGAG